MKKYGHCAICGVHTAYHPLVFTGGVYLCYSCTQTPKGTQVSK